MELEAVIFDLDNTLVDSRHDYREMSRRLKEVFEERGLWQEDPENPRKIWQIVRGGMEGIRGLGLSEDESRKLMDDVNDALTAAEITALDTAKPMPNALETLDALKKMGLKVGIATRSGAAYARRCVEKTGISPFVDAMLARDEVDYPKPSPDHLIQVVDMLEATPENVVYIGDSTTDLTTARAAGITFLGFWWSDERVMRMREAGCQDFIRDLKEILDFIEEK
jgi:HAD superfamily hydrolase (TIGR01509 family)